MARITFLKDEEDNYYRQWWMDNTTGKIHTFECEMANIPPINFDTGKCTCKEEPPMLVKLMFFERRLNGF